MLNLTGEGRLGYMPIFSIPVHRNGIIHQFPTLAEMTSSLWCGNVTAVV